MVLVPLSVLAQAMVAQLQLPVQQLQQQPVLRATQGRMNKHLSGTHMTRRTTGTGTETEQTQWIRTSTTCASCDFQDA